VVKVSNWLALDVNYPRAIGIEAIAHILGLLHDREELTGHINYPRSLRFCLSSLKPDTAGLHVHVLIPPEGEHFAFPQAGEKADRGCHLNVVRRGTSDAQVGIVIAEAFPNVVLGEFREVWNVEDLGRGLPLAKDHHPVQAVQFTIDRGGRGLLP
jgi:hypothetical protein